MISKRQAREMLAILDRDPDLLREFLSSISVRETSRLARLSEGDLNSELAALSSAAPALPEPAVWDFRADIESGAMTSVPIFEERGKNWCAIVYRDPREPSGFFRAFLEKARGESFYILDSRVRAGTHLEFGADYYRGSGRKVPQREYYEVLFVSDVEIYLKKISSSDIMMAEKYAKLFASTPSNEKQ